MGAWEEQVVWWTTTQEEQVVRWPTTRGRILPTSIPCYGEPHTSQFGGSVVTYSQGTIPDVVGSHSIRCLGELKGPEAGERDKESGRGLWKLRTRPSQRQYYVDNKSRQFTRALSHP